MAKANALLDSLDRAFDVAEEKRLALQAANVASATVIAEKQAALDLVIGEQRMLTSAADAAYGQAKAELMNIRDQLNERIGTITGIGTNPRVVVR